MSGVIETIVDSALRTAGIPIVGVSFGDLSNRATWRIDFDPTATPSQKSQGQTIVNTVAVDAAAQTAQSQKDAQSRIDGIEIVLKAIVLALIDQLNVIRAALPSPKPPITPAQALQAIRDKAGTL